MDKVTVRLSVFFEDPFYIGICERRMNDRLAVCRIIFGAEPKDYEILEYVLEKWQELKFSPTINDVVIKECTNPKRMQRTVNRQLKNMEIGTKSQQALKLQQTNSKLERTIKRHERKDAENERQFILKQQKRKGKHKGR
jgi:hypothetical protein